MGFILGRVFERPLEDRETVWYGGMTNEDGREESNKKAKQKGGIYGSTEENDTAHFLKWIRTRRETLW